MALPPGMWWALEGAASLALLFASAKAHGRQLRLEREAAGYHEVVFGGANPSFVEALWARDRRRFWTLMPFLALACGALLLVLRGAGAALVLALPWGMSLGFAAMGLASLARLRRTQPEAWRASRTGSAGWWGASLALAAVAAALLAA